jgi:hypothetical protein
VYSGLDSVPASQRVTAVNRNVIRFQDEVAMIMSIGLQCGTIYQRTMGTDLARLPADRRRALQEIWSGLLSSFVDSASEVRLRLSARARFARTIGQWGPELIVQLPLSDRRALMQQLQPRLARWDPAFRSDADRVMAALASRECAGLCLIE